MLEPATFVNGPHYNESGDQCPNCDNVGWYAVSNCSSLPWEAEQVQCEWCYTNPNSVFNLNKIHNKKDEN